MGEGGVGGGGAGRRSLPDSFYGGMYEDSGSSPLSPSRKEGKTGNKNNKNQCGEGEWVAMACCHVITIRPRISVINCTGRNLLAALNLPPAVTEAVAQSIARNMHRPPSAKTEVEGEKEEEGDEGDEGDKGAEEQATSTSASTASSPNKEASATASSVGTSPHLPPVILFCPLAARPPPSPLPCGTGKKKRPLNISRSSLPEWGWRRKRRTGARRDIAHSAAGGVSKSVSRGSRGVPAADIMYDDLDDLDDLDSEWNVAEGAGNLFSYSEGAFRVALSPRSSLPPLSATSALSSSPLGGGGRMHWGYS